MHQEPFEPEAFKRRKRKERIQAWLFSVLGGVVLLDSYAPVPIPLVGAPSILLGMGLLAYGYYQYNNYRKLPIHDAVQFAHSLDRHLTRADLFLAFRLSPEKTDQLLNELIQNGFIEPAEESLPPESEIRYRVIA